MIAGAGCQDPIGGGGDRRLTLDRAVRGFERLMGREKGGGEHGSSVARRSGWAGT